MKKFLKGILILLLSVIILFTAFAFVSGKTYLFKAVYYNFAGIDDYKIFDNNTVKAGSLNPGRSPDRIIKSNALIR